jgi:hypothetical protein
MENMPLPQVMKFTALEPGDFFIYSNIKGSSAAIVTITKQGNIGFISLGPTFPNGGTVPNLYHVRPSTVLSFGKAYDIKLAATPVAWHFNDQVEADDFMALAGGEKYIRIPYQSHYGADYFFVHLRTGNISDDAPDASIGYVNAWEIFTSGDENNESQSILKWPLPTV